MNDGNVGTTNHGGARHRDEDIREHQVQTTGENQVHMGQQAGVIQGGNNKNLERDNMGHPTWHPDERQSWFGPEHEAQYDALKSRLLNVDWSRGYSAEDLRKRPEFQDVPEEFWRDIPVDRLFHSLEDFWPQTTGLSGTRPLAGGPTTGPR